MLFCLSGLFSRARPINHPVSLRCQTRPQNPAASDPLKCLVPGKAAPSLRAQAQTGALNSAPSPSPPGTTDDERWKNFYLLTVDTAVFFLISNGFSVQMGQWQLVHRGKRQHWRIHTRKQCRTALQGRGLYGGCVEMWWRSCKGWGGRGETEDDDLHQHDEYWSFTVGVNEFQAFPFFSWCAT